MTVTPPPPEPGTRWRAEQTVLRVQQGVVLDAPLLPSWGSRTWAAVVWPDQRANGGWARAMMAASGNGRGYVADRLTPGDVVEFGADYPQRTGRKTSEMVPNRWYGVVLATAPDHVVAYGPFPGPFPAYQFADRAMQTWRQSMRVDIPGVTDLQTPAPPALPAARTARGSPVVELRTDTDVTRVDDPTHGRLVVDTALFGSAMATDTAELTGVLADVEGLRLRGDETKVTLAALTARHRPDTLTAAPPTQTEAPTRPSPSVDEARYYGHPDGTVERVDRSGARALRPALRWSPDGFAWGYQGDGPTELADALLADATGSTQASRRLAERYSSDVIAALPQAEAWSLPVTDVASWATAAEQRIPTTRAAGRRASSESAAGL